MTKPSRLVPVLHATVLANEPGHYFFGAWQNVTIVVWLRAADVIAAQRLAEISKSMLGRYPRGHSSVSFVLNGVGAPPPEAAAVLGRLLDDGNAELVCTAVVIEGEGFWASRMRSAITSMRLSAAGSLKLRLHNSLDEVLQWLPSEHEQRTGVELNPADLRRVIVDARSRALESVPK